MKSTSRTTNTDTVVTNADVLRYALRYLGTRVSVPTVQMHLEALYALMEIPIRSIPVAHNWSFSEILALHHVLK